jgi:hypothetical protein
MSIAEFDETELKNQKLRTSYRRSERTKRVNIKCLKYRNRNCRFRPKCLVNHGMPILWGYRS